jgi:hypothetical protein
MSALFKLDGAMRERLKRAARLFADAHFQQLGPKDYLLIENALLTGAIIALGGSLPDEGTPKDTVATPEPIKIWAFQDGPEHLRNMSEHGGDEDWIALVPSNYREVEYTKLNLLDRFVRWGVDAVEVHTTPEGDVYISAHG